MILCFRGRPLLQTFFLSTPDGEPDIKAIVQAHVQARKDKENDAKQVDFVRQLLGVQSELKNLKGMNVPGIKEAMRKTEVRY